MRRCCGVTVRRCGLALPRRHDLQPVSPRVVHVESPLRRDLGVVGPANVDACSRQRSRKPIERGDGVQGEGRVRLGGRREGIFDADVQFDRSASKPAPTPTCKQRRLLDFLEAYEGGANPEPALLDEIKRKRAERLAAGPKLRIEAAE